MDVLFTLDGLTLEKKWNEYYIGFMGGQMDDLPCEIRITSEEAAEIKRDKGKIREILDKYKDGRIPWTEEYFINSGIIDYLLFKGISIDSIKRIINKFNKYPVIEREFYLTIMFGKFPQNGGLSIEGYTAEKLYCKYNLTLLDTYNYLIDIKQHQKF